MKFNINDIAEQRFKTPVTIRIPTNDLNDKGKTAYAEATFIGLFRCVPVAEAREHLAELKGLQDSNDVHGAIEVGAKQIEKFFIGFEAVPGKELPFSGLENDVCTPEAIKALLNSREARDAIQTAYNKARSEDEPGKN